MYPILPIGPLSLPTGPILTLCALWLGLDVMSRYGQRLGLNSDDVWNVGMVALTAGLVVARLWNVVQFWGVYSTEPLLIVSLRPSGFALWPGIVAALIAGYGYMLRKALDPVRIAAALLFGGVTAGIVLNLAAFLTGSVVGTLLQPDSTFSAYLPQVLHHYGEPRHPAALYQALGLVLILGWGWFGRTVESPGRTILLLLLLYSLVRVIGDAFVAEAALIGPVRVSQTLALLGALILCLLLAQQSTDTVSIEMPA